MNKVTKIIYKFSNQVGQVPFPASKEYEIQFDGNDLHVVFFEPQEWNTKRFDEIESEIKSALFAGQIYSDRPFVLEFQKYLVASMGTEIEIFMSPDVHIRQANPPKEIKNANGEMIFDFSVKDVASLQSELNRYSLVDKTLRHILESYNEAYNNQENEFFYLYQIQDALAKLFTPKGEPDAVNLESKIGISFDSCKKFTRITNNSRYFQSRHRGRTFGGEEWAPTDEIWRARNHAKELIIRYLHYLKVRKGNLN
jgi:hypothetical protein